MNMIDLAKSYDPNFWPVENIYNVGQLIYVLRNHGDGRAADLLQEWKERIEYLVASEFHELPPLREDEMAQWGVVCEHPIESTFNHTETTIHFDCHDCGETGVTWDEL